MIHKPLIFRAIDPAIIDLYAAYFAEARAHQEAIEAFMVDVNISHPLQGGIWVPAFRSGVLVGVYSPTHPLELLDGWERCAVIDCYVPSQDSERGKRWTERLDEIPAAPEQVVPHEHGMVTAVEVNGGQHLHPQVMLIDLDGDRVLYAYWPSDQLRPLIERGVSELGGASRWLHTPCSEFYATIERAEDEAADREIADLLASAAGGDGPVAEADADDAEERTPADADTDD